MQKTVRTDRQVESLKPQEKRYTVRDADLRGHYVRVTPDGGKSFVVVARDPHGKQVWATIGGADAWKIGDARETAREIVKRIKSGLPAFEAPPEQPDTFKAVAETWLDRHVKRKGLRSAGEIERCLKKYIYPEWEKRDFGSIRRRDVTELLDTIEDGSGARQADHVLAIVRGVMNWQAARDDDYMSPIVRNMRRTSAAARARARILDDDELRAVWKVAETSGTFGAIVRLALLTGQRREKIATMRWQDISAEGEWTIASESREKGHAGALLLPEAALRIIRAQPRIGESPYVFPAKRARGRRIEADAHFNGWSPGKEALDVAVNAWWRERHGPDAEAPAHWTLHDLRRSSRSLMARAGVRPDIAERVLGHAISGVEGVYDRHSYRDEKADALKRLAGLLALVVDPPADNVRTLAHKG